MTGSLTVFTTVRPAQLGKVFTLHEGQLKKTVASNMCEGTYEVKTFTSREVLADLLQTIGTNQAISTSLPRTDELTGRLLTAALAAAAGCLARTKLDFVFRKVAGLLVLDYDPAKGQPVLTGDELWAWVLLICPAVANAGVVWWCSSSSHIVGPAGELQGLRGQRLYILIQDISDTERAGQVIADRCWLNGSGRVEVSTSGSRLFRTLWDGAMHQPARLDFVGGAICEPPLSQDRGEPVLMGGTGWLDTRSALPDLTVAEQTELERLKNDAREKAQLQADENREKWLAARINEEARRLMQGDKKMPKDAAIDQARRQLEAAVSGTLFGGFRIPLADGQSVTVSDVLDNWQQWHKKKTLDPLEPEHRNYEECGILYLTGSEARLFTFAHGGMTFRLARQPRRIVYGKGRQSAVADELAQALASQGDIFFSCGTDLVLALPGKFETLDRTAVQYLLGHRVALVVKRDGKDVPMNIPADLVSLTFAAMGRKPNQTPPTLVSVTSLPFATVSKRLVTQSGFDKETGIFNLMQDEAITLPDSPTREDCLVALRVLWAPWADFRWASDADRAGMLAAIFTAVLRHAMAIAPGVFFDAPVQASGKTKAGLALGALMTGHYVGVCPYADGRNLEEELSKSIIAKLRSECRFWMIDNVTGVFESAVLAALITSGRVQGRILGMSKEGDFSGRVLLVATGNNATLGSDLSRRFLRCRIDTGVERPSDIPHSFEPAQIAKDTRMKIDYAVLTEVAAQI